MGQWGKENLYPVIPHTRGPSKVAIIREGVSYLPHWTHRLKRQPWVSFLQCTAEFLKVDG